MTDSPDAKVMRKFFGTFAYNMPNGPIVGDIRHMLESHSDEELMRAFVAAVTHLKGYTL